MKNRARALAVLVAVLLLGCLLGIAGYRFLEKRIQKPPAVTSTQRVRNHTGRLASRLQLTKEQEVQLNSILEDSRRQIDTSRAEWESKLQTLRAKTNERIAAILNDEQRKQFQQFLGEAQSHGRSGNQARGHGDHQ
jgi:Spy/CpxP family protein refolding chaperone